MARPKIDINEEQLLKLAMIHCTVAEMAAVLGCSKDTLERRFAAVIEKGRDTGKMSLRRLQWEGAQKGNTALLIWLGKQLLGQKDISRIELDKIPDEALAQEAERRLKLVEPSS